MAYVTAAGSMRSLSRSSRPLAYVVCTAAHGSSGGKGGAASFAFSILCHTTAPPGDRTKRERAHGGCRLLRTGVAAL